VNDFSHRLKSGNAVILRYAPTAASTNPPGSIPYSALKEKAITRKETLRKEAVSVAFC